MDRPPNSIALGRVNELLQRPDADRIAILTGPGIFNEYKVKVYPSRKSLETFLKNPGHWFALVKTPVNRNMMLYPAFQKSL